MQISVRQIYWALAMAMLAALASSAQAGDSADFDWSGLIQPPAQPDAEQSRHFAEYAEALSNGAFAEAEVVAKQMIEQVDPAAPDRANRRARALHNLAIAQHAQGSQQSALQNYSAAIDDIVRNENNLSPSLILPLRGMARAFMDVGLQEEADVAFDRALHVSNVNEGPHSLSQLPILNARMEASLAQQDTESALDVMDRIHGLYTRKYARNSAELLPLYHQEAEFYKRLTMYGEEFNAWRHILIIKRKLHGSDSLELIEPHMRIAEINIRDLRGSAFRNVSTSDAEKHLKLALQIARENPAATWQVRKDCLLSLADFYTLFDMKGRARRYYAAAWKLLSSDADLETVRAAELEQPVPLSVVPPDPYANFEYERKVEDIDPSEFAVGEMVIEFTITDQGRTRDLRLVNAEPADFLPMQRRVENSVETFIYRPRHIEGKATDTGDQQYRVKYYYLPSDYQAAVARASKRGPN
jgi:tetratricopeptide (TPR) repeat protein